MPPAVRSRIGCWHARYATTHARGMAMATDTAVKVRFESQPLVRQYAALFTTEYGTEYQIMLWDGQSDIRFGVRNDGDWSYGTFRYADSWRERNGWPTWDKATFRRMITDFLAE